MNAAFKKRKGKDSEQTTKTDAFFVYTNKEHLQNLSYPDSDVLFQHFTLLTNKKTRTVLQ